MSIDFWKHSLKSWLYILIQKYWHDDEKNQTIKWALFVIIIPETKFTSALTVFTKTFCWAGSVHQTFCWTWIFHQTFCWVWNNHHFLFLFSVNSNNWQGYLYMNCRIIDFSQKKSYWLMKHIYMIMHDPSAMTYLS